MSPVHNVKMKIKKCIWASAEIILYHFALFIMTTSNLEQDYNKIIRAFQQHKDKHSLIRNINRSF